MVRKNNKFNSKNILRNESNNLFIRICYLLDYYYVFRFWKLNKSLVGKISMKIVKFDNCNCF